MIRVGETLPELELDVFVNNEIKKIKLSELKGKWAVFLFYPADFTFVCPTELEEAADLYDAFKKEGAELLSVSTDTVYVHKAWHDVSPAIKKVTYPMLADPSGRLCRLFGTYREENGLSIRGTFIVDPDGVLKAAEYHDNSFGRSTPETLRKVQAAKFVREHKGEVCPAKWTPGGKTLKPGVDLIGKI